MLSTLAVGDIHGDLNQLLYPLFDFLDGMDTKYERIVFLGDYIDRGESNLYVYLIVKFFMNIPKFKDKIIFLCGNHDVWEITNGFSPYIKPAYFVHAPELGGATRTFVFQHLTRLPLELSYYVKEWNILFTHAPQVFRDDDDVVTGTDGTPCQLSDSTRDKMQLYTWYKGCARWRGPEQHYKNICGHIHVFEDKALDYIIKGEGDQVPFASIDGDSSYFFHVYTEHSITLDDEPEEWKSQVLYIEIDKSGKSWNKRSIEVMFYDDNEQVPNYNLKRFAELKNEISKHLKRFNDLGNDIIEKLSIDDGVRAFEESFRSEFNIPEDEVITGRMILEKIKLRRNNNTSTIPAVYFNDVPLDVYQHYGCFTNERVNDVGMLFCKVIWSDLWYKAWKPLFNHRLVDSYGHVCEAVHSDPLREPKLDGGYKKVLNMIAFLLLVCVCLVVVVVVSINMLLSKRTMILAAGKNKAMPRI